MQPGCDTIRCGRTYNNPQAVPVLSVLHEFTTSEVEVCIEKSIH